MRALYFRKLISNLVGSIALLGSLFVAPAMANTVSLSGTLNNSHPYDSMKLYTYGYETWLETQALVGSGDLSMRFEYDYTGINYYSGYQQLESVDVDLNATILLNNENDFNAVLTQAQNNAYEDVVVTAFNSNAHLLNFNGIDFDNPITVVGAEGSATYDNLFADAPRASHYLDYDYTLDYAATKENDKVSAAQTLLVTDFFQNLPEQSVLAMENDLQFSELGQQGDYQINHSMRFWFDSEGAALAGQAALELSQQENPFWGFLTSKDVLFGNVDFSENTSTIGSIEAVISPVPEPSSLALMTLGLGFLAFRQRKKLLDLNASQLTN